MSKPNRTAIICVSAAGLALARTIASELSGEKEIFAVGTSFTDCTEDVSCVSSIAELIAESFARYDAWVFIGAMGICIRSIAPYVVDKHHDPAVVNVDSTGRYVVSVLSGHVGGANDLTRLIASAIGGEPVVTTQSDRTGLWALDTLASTYGWKAVSNTGDMNRPIRSSWGEHVRHWYWRLRGEEKIFWKGLVRLMSAFSTHSMLSIRRSSTSFWLFLPGTWRAGCR